MLVSEVPSAAAGHGWDAFVEGHPRGTLFHTTAWGNLIRRHFPHRPRYLEARSGGRRVGVLPLFETRSLLSGRGLISVPYGVYGGPLADTSAAETALIGRVREMVAGEGHRFAELRCVDAPAADLPASELYATFRRRLPADPEECLAEIPRKSRATTRQARDRHRLSFREAPELLAEFHRLFALNKQRLGSPSFSRRFFADVLRLPGAGTRLHVVSQDREILMAVISFTWGRTFNPYYSGSVPRADRVGAANFAYWKLMDSAVREGAEWFDFGRSRVDTGPYHFKRNMGFEPLPLCYRFVLGAGREVPAVNPSNPAFSLPRRILRGLPAPLMRAVGPSLMKLVP